MVRGVIFGTILAVSLGYSVFLHTRVETWKGLFFELEATATESVAGWQACQETFDSCATEAETAQKIAKAAMSALIHCRKLAERTEGNCL